MTHFAGTAATRSRISAFRWRHARALAALLAPVVLAACSASGSSEAPFAYGVETQVLSGSPARIEARVRDPLPLAQAVLIDDGGVRHPAVEITRDRVIYHGGGAPAPGIGVGVMGGSSGNIATGIGIGIPFFGGSSGQTVSVNESRAHFVIPDIERYAATWQEWTLSLVLDDGRTSRTIEMLPPAPPGDGS